MEKASLKIRMSRHFSLLFDSEEIRKAENDVARYVNQQYTIPGFQKKARFR